MISILMLSWERHDLLKQSFGENLKRCGHPYKLYVCDQGSKDQRVLDYLKSFYPTYFRKNSQNEGICRSFNQLYLRSSGDYVALMSNDIVWPDKWGSIMVEWGRKVPNPGIIGFSWGNHHVLPVSKKFGIEAHWLKEYSDGVYGPMIIPVHVINELGFFREDFDNYGLEDRDFNERVNRAGFNSFYIPGFQSNHLGHDVGQKSEYRRLKDESLIKNSKTFDTYVEQYINGGSLRFPLPERRSEL